ncbi:MAG TPA: FGGY family carbohydrate kinase, partial [Thermoanaerobaculia bacterium]|nr:FGGY family carbohydrate kinase [Thermoanaerobaculia bacterium]
MTDRGVVLSLDEGTTGATAVVVGLDGGVRAKGYRGITQHYPQPGWVEHDPLEIWSAVQLSAKQALHSAGVSASEVRA